MTDWSLERLSALADRGYAMLLDAHRETPCILAAEPAPGLSAEDVRDASEAGDVLLHWAAGNLGAASFAELRADGGRTVLFSDQRDGTVVSILCEGRRLTMILCHSAEHLSLEIRREISAIGLVHAAHAGRMEPEPLGARELAYLRKVAAGDSDLDIAGELNLSMRSVKERKKRVIADLGAENINHAVFLAKRLGII